MKSYEEFREKFQSETEAGFQGDSAETHISEDGFILTDDSGNALDDEGDLVSFPEEYSAVYETRGEANGAIADYADNNPEAPALILRPISLTLTIGAPVGTTQTGGDIVDEAIAGIATRD